MTKFNYEAWRPALIAFLEHDGPWFTTIENLRLGRPLTDENKRMIDGLVAATRLAA